MSTEEADFDALAAAEAHAEAEHHARLLGNLAGSRGADAGRVRAVVRCGKGHRLGEARTLPGYGLVFLPARKGTAVALGRGDAGLVTTPAECRCGRWLVDGGDLTEHVRAGMRSPFIASRATPSPDTGPYLRDLLKRLRSGNGTSSF